MTPIYARILKVSTYFHTRVGDFVIVLINVRVCKCLRCNITQPHKTVVI